MSGGWQRFQDQPVNSFVRIGEGSQVDFWFQRDRRA